ncbi:MAG: FHA domain-containing protein [bacterium]
MSASTRTAVAAGDGLVMRTEDVLLVALGSDTAKADVVRAVVAHHVAGDLMRELALLVMHEDGLPSFGVAMGPLEDAILFLYGDIEFAALVGGAMMSGRGVAGREWTERSLPGPAAWIALGASATRPPEQEFWDLRGGTVPGGGAWLVASPVPATAAAPSAAGPAPAEPASPTPQELPPSVVLVDLGGGEPARAPLPPTPVAAPLPDADDEPEVIVKGIRCPDGHHNNPRASYCVICGRRMGVSQSLVLVDGPRPPLGVLLLDDGSTIPVRSDMVIGRSPEQSPLVTSGEARAIALSDTTQSISRIHLHVHLDEWEVLVKDLGSSNGSFTWDDATQSWQRIDPGVALTLDNRHRLRLGEREVLYSQHHTKD